MLQNAMGKMLAQSGLADLDARLDQTGDDEQPLGRLLSDRARDRVRGTGRPTRGAPPLERSDHG